MAGARATQVVRVTSGGTQQELVAVVATLTSASVFQPMRRRTQSVIDRRFYRRKYDASRILLAFATRVRDDVDLQHLTASLLSVVDEALEPEHASLWLPKPEQRRRP